MPSHLFFFYSVCVKSIRDLIAMESVTPIPLKLHASQKYLAVTGRLIAGPKQVLEPAAPMALHARFGLGAGKGPVIGLGPEFLQRRVK